MNPHRVLITGSNGLIGSILWNHFSDKHELLGLDISSPNKHEGTINVDLSCYEQTLEIIKHFRPTNILHLAADSKPTAGLKSIWKNNIVATKNVYASASKSEVERVIFASSNHVTHGYERIIRFLSRKNIHIKITTSYPAWPSSYYGFSKLFCEGIARKHYNTTGLESIILRIGTVIKEDDPRQNRRFLATWLSHNDLIQLFEKSISTRIKFGIYYGVSDNKTRFWDISNAATKLGFIPEDDASVYI